MADGSSDLLIIGAGIVGLATALEATRRFPRMRLISWTRIPRGRSSNRPQQRRNSFRPLLQDRLLEGAELRCRSGFDETLLPGAGDSIRRMRQAGACHHRRGGSATRGPASARHRQRSARAAWLQREAFREIEPHCNEESAPCKCLPPASSTTPSSPRNMPA